MRPLAIVALVVIALVACGGAVALPPCGGDAGAEVDAAPDAAEEEVLEAGWRYCAKLPLGDGYGCIDGGADCSGCPTFCTVGDASGICMQ